MKVLRLLRRRVTLALLAAVFLVLVAGPILASRFASNIGLTRLNQVLMQRETLQSSAGADADLLQAEDWLRKAVALDTGNLGAWRGLGFVFSLQGKESEAMSAWSNARATAEDFVNFGERMRLSMQYATAIEWYARAVELQPASGIPRYFMGLSYEGLGDWNKAYELFRQASQYTDTQSIVSSLDFHMGIIVHLHVESADLSAALEYYNEAITHDRFFVDQERVETHYYRGNVLQSLNRLAEARQEFEQVIDANPDHYWALVGLGTVVWQEDSDADRAEVYLKRGITLRPEVKWAYRQLGMVYQASGRGDQAVEMYRQVLSIDPLDGYVDEQLRKLTQPEGWR